MECSCGTRVQSCTQCGKLLASADDLQRLIEEHPLTIGSKYRGKTIPELLRKDPTLISKWSAARGTTPEMKLLVLYAKFRLARAALERGAADAGIVAQHHNEVARPAFLPAQPDERPAPRSWWGPRGGSTGETPEGSTGVGEIVTSLRHGASKVNSQVSAFFEHLVHVVQQARGLPANRHVVKLLPMLFWLTIGLLFFPLVWFYAIKFTVHGVFYLSLYSGYGLAEGILTIISERTEAAAQAAKETFLYFAQYVAAIQDQFTIGLEESLPEELEPETRSSIAAVSSFLTTMTTLAFLLRKVMLWEGL